MPAPEDIVAGMSQTKTKLMKYETSLKKFQYKKALNEAIDQQNPEVVLALMEELIHRGALEIALSNRSEPELVKLVEFIQWKVTDYRYQPLLLQVFRFLIDMYSGVLGTGHSTTLDHLFTTSMHTSLSQQIQLSESLLQLKGQIEMIEKMG